jgi:hypothetical protein
MVAAEFSDELTPLARLLSAHGGQDADWHRLLWAFDARMAQVLRTVSEPMIAQMRFTWWYEALGDVMAVKGNGEPLLDALRATGRTLAPLQRMVEGWEELIDPELSEEALARFAERRGGGLFEALAPRDPPKEDAVGALWALWDFSGHSSEVGPSRTAVKLASRYLVAARKERLSGVPRMLAAMARADIAAGRPAPSSLTPGLYGRILRIGLIGR